MTTVPPMTTISTPIHSKLDLKHARSRSDNVLLSLTPPSSSKRSYSSLNDDLDLDFEHYFKKSKTAPPSPPYVYDKRSKSLSPLLVNSPSPVNNYTNNYKLSNIPSSSASIASTASSDKSSNTSTSSIETVATIVTDSKPSRQTSKILSPKPQSAINDSTYKRFLNQKIIPSISLSYYDTHPIPKQTKKKLINNLKKFPNVYTNYQNELNKLNLPSISSILNEFGKIPSTESIILPPPINLYSYSTVSSNDKVKNFPYVSNYNYLEKFYMKDVENYPTYLKAAESLLDLSNSVQPALNNSINYGDYKGSSPNAHSYNYQQQPQPMPVQLPVTEQQFPSPTHLHQPIAHENSYVAPITTSPKPSSPKNPKSPSKYTHPKSPKSFAHSQTTLNSSTSAPITAVTNIRKCISCSSSTSPCWRPSWSTQAGQLCNSCGLRYKKTGARCLNGKCGRIPAKGEWGVMKSRGKFLVRVDEANKMMDCYLCLHCGSGVEVNEK